MKFHNILETLPFNSIIALNSLKLSLVEGEFDKLLINRKLYLQEKPDPGVDLTVLNLENFLNMEENIQSNLPFKLCSNSWHQDTKELQVQIILLA